MLNQRSKRPLFPPPDQAISDLPPARNKGDRPLEVLTATGTVTVKRRYFWSKATGGSCPVDALVGIYNRTVTAGARCLLCTLGVIEDFKQAAAAEKTIISRMEGVQHGPTSGLQCILDSLLSS